jgi:two-component system cell cycle sensor histidine kinase/response regulator CckA
MSNPMAHEFLGISEDQMNGKTAIDPTWHLLDEQGRRLRPEDYPVSQAIVTRRLVRDLVAGAIRPDGTRKWFLVNADPILDEAGALTEVVATFVDITDRKQAELEREQYFKFFNTSRDLMGITDLHGVFKRVNRAFVDTLGYSEEELVNGPLVRFVHPEDQRATLDETARMRETGHTVRFENRFVCKDGSLRWLSWHAIVNYQEGFAYATARDITDQKKAEEELRQTEARQRQLEKELIQAQKLESLGTLASGVAHDFNNLLGIILGYTSMLEQQALDPKIAQRIQSIQQAALRGASLVKQLLTIARKGESHFESLSLNEITRETIELLHRTFPKTISLISELSDTELVRGDSAQIHQILLNICLNARDAMPQGGTLRIASQMKDGTAVAAEFPRANADEYVFLSVADSGIGMDEETRRRIFEPFFTTKGPGKGSGLGLTLVYSIVENHRGFIAVDSMPGAGTTFRIYLPVDRTSDAPGTPGPARTETPCGTETVLFVEDEEMLAAIIREILTEKGYTVLVAADGETGVTLFREKHQEIDIVLSDLGLPGLPGEEVVRRIKSIDPRAIVLVASGFVDPGVRARLTDLGVRHIIQKPYAPSEVLEVIRAAIDAGKPIPL